MKDLNNYYRVLLQVINGFALIFISKSLFENLGKEDYGNYVFYVSIISVLSILFLPSSQIILTKAAVNKNYGYLNFLINKTISHLKYIPFILILIYFIENSLLYIFLLGVITNHVLRGDNFLHGLNSNYSINLSRLLYTITNIIFLIIIQLINLNLICIIIIFYSLQFVRAILIWKYILDNYFDKCQFKTYDYKTSSKNLGFTTIFNVIFSHLDKLVFGLISKEFLAIYNIHNVIPNAFKTNIKFLILKKKNEILSLNKIGIESYFKKHKAQLVLANILFFITINIFSLVYLKFIKDSELNFILLLLLSSISILRVNSDQLFAFDIHKRNGRMFKKFSVLGKLIYVFLIIIFYNFFKEFGIIYSLLIFEIIFFFLAIKSFKNG